MKDSNTEVIIVGAGLAGLSCARRLMEANIPFVILEADERIGGRLKTDTVDGFLLDRGFQVLQTAYPEARRVPDYDRLALMPFSPGAVIRIDGGFHRIADPRRRPQDLWSTLTAPLGTMGDRMGQQPDRPECCVANLCAGRPASDIRRGDRTSRCRRIIRGNDRPPGAHRMVRSGGR